MTIPGLYKQMPAMPFNSRNELAVCCQEGVHVGDTVKGEVVMVDDKGLLVNIARNLNAFVPNEHISDLGAQQGKTKHKVGSKVSGRILKQDPSKRRMTMTLKKALIGSKLKPLISWEVRPSLRRFPRSE